MKKIFIFVLIASMCITVNVKAIGLNKVTSFINVLDPIVDDANTGTNNNEVTDAGTGGASSGGSVGCEVIGEEFQEWIKNVLKIVQYAGVGLAVVLTAIDFIGVISGSKDDAMGKAFGRALGRLGAVVMLLLVSVLVNFIIGTFIDPVVDDVTIPNCVDIE